MDPIVPRARDLQAVGAIADALRRSEVGRRLWIRVRAQPVEYRLVPKWRLWDARGMGGGSYDPEQRAIAIVSSLSRDEQIAILAHEMQHALDHHLGYPLDTVIEEVRALLTQAFVIKELSLDCACLGLSSAGDPLSVAQVADAIRERRYYRELGFHPSTVHNVMHPLLDDDEVRAGSTLRQKTQLPRPVAGNETLEGWTA